MSENQIDHVDDSELTNFRFELEISTRYHDWRRARIGLYVNCVRVVALAGSVVTLVTLFSAWGWASGILIGVNLFVAIITLLDLVFQSDGSARKHDVLYRRFKDLQASVARGSAEWQ